VKVNVGAFNMPDNPVNNDVLLKIVERLDAIEQQMHKGFAALMQGQDDLRNDQEAMRKEQQALSKRMEDGFADAAQERLALGRRIDDGLATEAAERRVLAHKLDELKNWLVKEIPANASLLFDHILADRQKSESFRQEMVKFQNDVKEALESIKRVLEKHEQRLLSLEELVALLHREFVEFKKERFIHDREVQQRLSRLEAAA
jgi:hypothetical protein